MGIALGATVGGAMGLAGGVTLGALASVLIPGVGPILAIGFAASAVGLLGGGALGGKLDNSLSDGIPQEELYIYEDALRQGRSVVIAFAENHAQVEAAHHTLNESGAESIDRAREMWWIGLRDIEKEHYDAGAEKFQQSEKEFRAGFEAAQHPANRDQSYEESRDRPRRALPHRAQKRCLPPGIRTRPHLLPTNQQNSRALKHLPKPQITAR